MAQNIDSTNDTDLIIRTD